MTASVCGTSAGYFRHRRANETICEACAKAHSARNSIRNLVVEEEEVGACGTPAGYHRHTSAKEPACRSCKDAHALYERDRRRNRGLTAAPEHKPIRRVRTLVKLPLEVFADLYWTASPKALAALDEVLGPKKVDQLIKQSEQE